MWVTTKQYRSLYNISPQCLYEMKKTQQNIDKRYKKWKIFNIC